MRNDNEKPGIVISSHNGGSVTISGDTSGGVVISGDINTGGATVIMHSTGNVHHGSGDQINISVRTKKQ